MNFILIGSLVLFIFIILFCFYLLRQNRELEISKKRLEHQVKLLETDQMKYRLQPHAINNVLAGLKATSNKLTRGINSLSNVLEYIIYKGDKHLVAVCDEIDFIKSFIQLNELFIDSNDAIVIREEVDRNSPYYSTNLCIPHLISAYFLENAFKHGDKQAQEFLTIHTELRNNVFILKVTNKIKVIPNQMKPHGIGLQNMNKRLDLLMPDRYEISQSCNEKEYISKLVIHLNK